MRPSPRQTFETFFVVSGAPTFTCGSDTITAQPGTLMAAPPGTVLHTFANPGEQPVVMLWTVTPDLYINYFRELANLRPGPNGLDPKQVGEVMSRYATEVVRAILGRGPGTLEEYTREVAGELR